MPDLIKLIVQILMLRRGENAMILIYEVLYLFVTLEGALLSQMMEVPEVQYNQSFINTSRFM